MKYVELKDYLEKKGDVIEEDYYDPKIVKTFLDVDIYLLDSQRLKLKFGLGGEFIFGLLNDDESFYCYIKEMDNVLILNKLEQVDMLVNPTLAFYN